MKKNGFTLAEVLITLTIIGVIATMTLPALMTNTQEQQAKAGLKKGVNTLTEAVGMSNATDGLTFTSIKRYGDATLAINADENKKSLFALLDSYTNIDYGATNAANGDESEDYEKPAGYQAVVLRDGSCVFIPESADLADEVKTPAADGVAKGYDIIYDTNGGIKGPNLISTCTGGEETETEESGDTTDIQSIDTSACELKGSRQISDRFTLRLRGIIVEPADAATAWALRN